MDHSTYSLEIQNYINQILEHHTADVNISLTYCEKLKKLGEEMEDAYLLGFSYYYLGEAYYYCCDAKKQLISLFNAIEYLKVSEEWDLVARSYNMLGILSNAQGNPASSVDYYLDGLGVCRTHKLYYVAGMIHSNISTLFVEIEDYERAIEHLEHSLEYFAKVTDKTLASNCINNNCVSNLSLGQCHLHLGNIEKATACMEKINKYIASVPASYIGISAAVFKTMLAHAQGDFERRDAGIEDILSLSKQDCSLLTFYDDFLTISRFLLEIEKDSALLKILDVFENMAGQAQNLHIQIEILKIRLAFYKRTNQDFLFLHAARYFYELSLKQEEENQKITTSAIELRFSLEQLESQQKLMEYENQKLVLKSESDALTRLPNRYKMNDISEVFLRNALQNQVPFAVEILDIDYFKQYNDTYGHQAGDTCLAAIARELKTMMTDDIFCARYGGDEFIILYYNKTEKEVHALAEDLRQRVCRLNIKHSGSLSAPHVTITQGIHYRIPTPGNRMWDYLHAADNALYEGKKSSRGCVIMTTSK